MVRLGIACLALSLCGGSILGQTERPHFEVASVRRAAENEEQAYNPGPGTFQAHSLPMRILIQMAYRVKDFQVIGEPGWFTEEPYSIDAKMPAGAHDAAEVRLMLQALLEDRFQMRIRHETRDLPIYVLGLAKGGAKLVASNCESGAPKSCGAISMPYNGVSTSFRGRGVSIAELVSSIVYVTKRVVIDRTGITQTFDIDLAFDREGALSVADDERYPSLAIALKDGLGLSLTEQRGPVEVLVIDHVERPSAN